MAMIKRLTFLHVLLHLVNPELLVLIGSLWPLKMAGFSRRLRPLLIICKLSPWAPPLYWLQRDRYWRWAVYTLVSFTAYGNHIDKSLRLCSFYLCLRTISSERSWTLRSKNSPEFHLDSINVCERSHQNIPLFPRMGLYVCRSVSVKVCMCWLSSD